MSRILIFGSAVTLLLGGAVAPRPVAADDYDADCAVILCLAAGFPVEPSGICGAAYDYMIDRITDRPPKPPFGTCTMNDGAAYDAAEVMFDQPSPRSHDGWICPEPAPMAFDATADHTFTAPTCYPDAEYSPPLFVGRPSYWFLGAPVPAKRVAYRLRLTLPGADGETYVSPMFLSNPGTGFSLSLTDEGLAEFEAQPKLSMGGAP